MREPNPGRPTRAAYIEPPAHAPNAALLIDFDNVTMGIRSDLQNQLRRLLDSEIIKGKVAVQRAYADWRRYPQYIVPLSEASIDLIFAPAFGSNKKNATDIRLAIDALELVFTRPEIGTFILLSGDSDFSSLVLKLKEYGKYVIGVGIRESSSDLLVQNCDEYYSYSELTGLTREGEVDHVRRDPWELVVEAVRQMKKDNDVMRSDRLKQVMQALDPNFDEKDAGFSRFSKFVVEAAHRGLLALSKLENGQYGVEIGENANVPPGEEAELRKQESKGEEERGTRSRRKRTRRREEASQPSLTLAEAFELLQQALLVLGAAGEAQTSAEDTRNKMVELLGDDSDPLFQRARFQRLMRQAHDANLIELVKADGGGYLLKLGPEAAVGQPSADGGGGPLHPDAASSGAKPADPTAASPRKRPPRSRAATRKSSKRGGRSSSTRSAARTPEDAPAEVEHAEPPAGKAEGAQVKRNPRYRRGSRGRAGTVVKPGGASGGEGRSPASDTVEEPQPRRSHGARSLGRRAGSRRGTRRGGAVASDPSHAPAHGEGQPRAAESRAGQAAAPTPPEMQPPPESPAPEGRSTGESLLKRMTAALQKVVKAPDSPADGP